MAHRADPPGEARWAGLLAHELRGSLQTLLTSVELLSAQAQTPSGVRALERLRRLQSHWEARATALEVLAQPAPRARLCPCCSQPLSMEAPP